MENRRRPRYKLGVAIKVYARGQRVLRGETVDISESGISALLRDEVPLGEVVRLEFTLASGEVEVLAVARQRNAFRFGFEFLEDRGEFFPRPGPGVEQTGVSLVKRARRFRQSGNRDCLGVGYNAVYP